MRLRRMGNKWGSAEGLQWLGNGIRLYEMIIKVWIYKMDSIIVWVSDNKEWLFSGMGCTVVLLIIAIFQKHNVRSSAITQKSGNNSTNIQVGGDFTVGKSKSKKR